MNNLNLAVEDFMKQEQRMIEADEVKACFDDVLLKAQTSPVLVTIDGKPSAVIVSVENFKAAKEIKRQIRQKFTLMRLF